jgi:hypothetical protein
MGLGNNHANPLKGTETTMNTTETELANGQPFPSLGSRDLPVQNADGSTYLFLGPKAPEGKEKNWLATVPERGYFAILRLYGPTEPALAKSWKPGDVAKMK